MYSRDSYLFVCPFILVVHSFFLQFLLPHLIEANVSIFYPLHWCQLPTVLKEVIRSLPPNHNTGRNRRKMCLIWSRNIGGIRAFVLSSHRFILFRRILHPAI